MTSISHLFSIVQSQCILHFSSDIVWASTQLAGRSCSGIQKNGNRKRVGHKESERKRVSKSEPALLPVRFIGRVGLFRWQDVDGPTLTQSRTQR